MGVPVAAIAGLALFEFGRFLAQVTLPQTITADRNGSAEPITVVLRRSPLQLVPLLNVAIALWFLNLRALALAPRAEPVGQE